MHGEQDSNSRGLPFRICDARSLFSPTFPLRLPGIGLRHRQHSRIRSTVIDEVETALDSPGRRGNGSREPPSYCSEHFCMTADRDHRRFHDCRIAFVPRVPSQLPTHHCPTVFPWVPAARQWPLSPHLRWPSGPEAGKNLMGQMANRRMLDACPRGSPRRAPRTHGVLGWARSKLSEGQHEREREVLRRQTLDVGARVSEDGGPCEDHRRLPHPHPITGNAYR